MSRADKLAKLPAAHRDAIAQLSEKHGAGGLYVLPLGEDMLAFRRATLEEWDEYTAGVLDEARQVTATRELLEQLLVYPSSADFAGLVRRQPALPMSIMSGKKGGRSLGGWLGSGLSIEGEEL